MGLVATRVLRRCRAWLAPHVVGFPAGPLRLAGFPRCRVPRRGAWRRAGPLRGAVGCGDGPAGVVCRTASLYVRHTTPSGPSPPVGGYEDGGWGLTSVVPCRSSTKGIRLSVGPPISPEPAGTHRDARPNWLGIHPPTGGDGSEGQGVCPDVKRSSPDTPPAPEARHRGRKPRAADRQRAAGANGRRRQAQEGEPLRRESRQRGKQTSKHLREERLGPLVARVGEDVAWMAGFDHHAVVHEDQ